MIEVDTVLAAADCNGIVAGCIGRTAAVGDTVLVVPGPKRISKPLEGPKISQSMFRVPEKSQVIQVAIEDFVHMT